MTQENGGSRLPSRSLAPISSNRPPAWGLGNSSKDLGDGREYLQDHGAAVREDLKDLKEWLKQAHEKHSEKMRNDSAEYFREMIDIFQSQVQKQDKSAEQLNELRDIVLRQVEKQDDELRQLRELMQLTELLKEGFGASCPSVNTVDPRRNADAQALDGSCDAAWNDGREASRLHYLTQSSLKDYIYDGLEHSDKDPIKHVDWHHKASQEDDEKLSFRLQILQHLGAAEDNALKKKRNLVARLVRSKWFRGASFVLIVINTVFIAVEANISVTRSLADPPEEIPDFFEAIDNTFIGIFLVELVLRMYGERWLFFFGLNRHWNSFDLVLFVVTFLTKIALGRQLETALNFLGIQTVFKRSVRTFRSVRILRILRTMYYSRSLKTMILSIIAALPSLAWALFLLLLITFVFAITIMQSISDHMVLATEDTQPSEAAVDAYRHWYRNLPIAIFSLMQAISGGTDWGDIVEPLAEISSLWKISFSFYIVFIVFGVLNILTGVFVNTASTIKDIEMTVADEKQRAISFVKDMEALFEEFDAAKQKERFPPFGTKGSFTWNEFRKYMRHEKFQEMFASEGLACSDAFTIFKILEEKEKKNKRKEDATYMFNPGELGVTCDETGLVKAVVSGKQAHARGIKEGHQIVSVACTKDPRIHSFKGRSGIDINAKGVVQKVTVPASTKKIKKGDRVLKVDGEPYSKEAFIGAEMSGSNYDIAVENKKEEMPYSKDILLGAEKSGNYYRVTFDVEDDDEPKALRLPMNGSLSRSGILCDDNGMVEKIEDNEKAHEWGLKKGDRIVKVGTEPYSKDALDRKEKCGLDYEVTFQEATGVDIKKFILGCVRLRGQATRMNLMAVSSDLERQDHALQQIHKSLGSIHSDVSGILKALCSYTELQEEEAREGMKRYVRSQKERI